MTETIRVEDATLSVLALCRIERGGFSGERIFHVTQADGKEHAGVTPVGYCHHLDGRPLDRDEPAGDECLDGLLDVILPRNGGEEARIHMPDGETIAVHTSQLVRHVVKETAYVPFAPHCSEREE